MENGLALAAMSAIYTKLKLYYRASLLSRFMIILGAFSKKLFSHSRIWRLISRPERTTKAYYESVTGRLLEKILGAFSNFIYKSDNILRASILGRTVLFLAESPAAILGIYVFIQTAVPHHYWYNWLNLGLTFIVFALYVIKCAGNKEYMLSLKNMDFAVLLFLIVCTISALTSIVPSDSIRIFILYVIPMSIVFVMVNAIKTKSDLNIFLWMLSAGLTVACLYGLWQYAAGIEVDVRLIDTQVSGSIRRLFSTMGNPNNYAEYLVACMPFFAALFLNAKTIRTKLIMAGLFLLPLLNLVLTSSRSSWLGFVVAVIIFIFFTYRKVLPFAIISGLAAIPFLPDSIRLRILTIGRDSSSKYRVVIWQGAFNMLKDYWVTGIGQGPAPFMALFSRYSKLSGVVHSHMLPLQIWLETGIMGISTFVWMLARFFKKTAKFAFGGNDAQLNRINAAALSGIAGLVFIGLFEYIWFYPRVMSIFWILTGILMVSLKIGANGAENARK